MNVFPVCWEHRATRYLIDFDDEAMALKAAIELAEWGRIGITVGRVDYEPDPERTERIRQRINDRLAMEWAIGAIT